MIKLENVSFKYKANNVIQDINININEGEFISIIGKNGSREINISKIDSRINNTKNRDYYGR